MHHISGPAIERFCLNCGTLFLADLRDIGRGRGKCCSLKCASQTGAPLGGQKATDWFNSLPKFTPKCPELKIQAESAFWQKIRSGKIRRRPREICGSEKDVHGHHDDYSKPFDVKWFCRKHHWEYHFDRPDLLNP